MSSPRVRARSSILFKMAGVLVLALVVSTTLTAAVTSRLTDAALAAQARRTAKGHLEVLQEAYAGRERTLVVNLRNLAEQIFAAGLMEPSRQADLIAELGRTSTNLELDVLQVFDRSGHEVVSAGGAGRALRDQPLSPQVVTRNEPSSRLVEANDGKFMQVVPVPVGPGPVGFVVVGGYEFADAFAYALRRQIGSINDVVLVANERVVGSTLHDPPVVAPAVNDDGDLPRLPALVHLNGEPSLVAYSAVGRGTQDSAGGALGVVLTNPVAPLHASLARIRLVAGLLLTLIVIGLGGLLFRTLIRPLLDLTITARRVASGDQAAKFTARRDDEIGLLAESLESMRQELAARLELIANQAGALQDSSRRIVLAQDEERHRLARDLHDGLQQRLIVLRMQLGMLHDSGKPEGSPGLFVDGLGEELDRVIQQLREVTANLYPSILLDRGLAAALHSYVGRVPLSTHLRTVPEEFPRLAPQVESGAYFLLCEAITNTLKHAGASTINIGLRADDDRLEVCVADDGCGFDTGSVGRGGGLLHMQDRVRSLGGTLDIRSEPQGGTRVVATFPELTAMDAAR